MLMVCVGFHRVESKVAVQKFQKGEEENGMGCQVMLSNVNIYLHDQYS